MITNVDSPYTSATVPVITSDSAQSRSEMRIGHPHVHPRQRLLHSHAEALTCLYWLPMTTQWQSKEAPNSVLHAARQSLMETQMPQLTHTASQSNTQPTSIQRVQTYLCHSKAKLSPEGVRSALERTWEHQRHVCVSLSFRCKIRRCRLCCVISMNVLHNKVHHSRISLACRLYCCRALVCRLL